MEAMKTAIMGSPDMIRVFGAFGIDRYPVIGREEAISTLKDLAGGSYAIVLLTETLAREVPELTEMYRNEALPSVVIIPVGADKSHDSMGMSILRNSARKAAGIDILGR